MTCYVCIVRRLLGGCSDKLLNSIPGNHEVCGNIISEGYTVMYYVK